MNNTTNDNSMLGGYRILDLSDYRGFACSKFLSSMGAEVIKIDSPQQSRKRTTANDLWQLRNLGKKSITLNLESEEGISIFCELVTLSDFVIETFEPGYLAEKKLDYDELKKINPEIILVSITPFGQTGPYKNYKGGELITSAMGGTLDTCGYPEETPVLEALDACSFHATAAASFGAMLAHRERGISGLGQHVDCSMQEVAASRNTNNLLSYQFDKRKLERGGNKVRFGIATVRVVWELKDGYCFHSLMTGRFGAPANSALSQWMTDENFDNPMADVDWASYDRSALDPNTRLEWETAIHDFFTTKTKADIKSEGEKRGIRATIANSPDDVLNDQHLTSRGFLQAIQLDDNLVIQYPEYFLRLSEGHYRIPHHLPSLGKDNEDVFSGLLKLKPEKIKEHKKSGVL
ncbi:MAG: CaiB/BaiF CoA transferase family protein [Cellvibrionaceae bacterium]